MEETEALFGSGKLQECAPGTVFFTPEDSSERLFVLKYGQVLLYRLTAGGKRLAIRRVAEGKLFGEMGLLGQSMHGCFAEAQEQSLVCSATRVDVLGLFQQRPELALRMLESAGRRRQYLEQRLERTAFSPVQARLADFLLRNAEPETNTVRGFTHEEIGDDIGAIRQTVTETLGVMEKGKLLEVANKRIRIVNTAGLRSLADQ